MQKDHLDLPPYLIQLSHIQINYMPFFSIIIPTYNRATIIQETLANIQGQLFNDWECIVVDDGSTDNTKQVVTNLIAKDNRIKYVYQVNAERSAARNNGARNATGNYLIFLDSDDAFDSRYLKELHSFLQGQNNPKALIVSDYCVWDGAEKKTIVQLPNISKNESEWLFDYPVSPSRACVHNEIINQHQFREDIVIVEDSVLWVSIASEYPVLHFQFPLVWYRVHEGNSVNPNTDSSIHRLAGLKLFFKDDLSNRLSKQFKNKLLSDCCFSIAQYYKMKGKKMTSLLFLSKSIVRKFKHDQTKAKVFMILSLLPFFESFWRSYQESKK